MGQFALVAAALGAVASVVGAGVTAVGAAEAADASKRAERLRQRQADLEAARQKRQVLRNQLKARSLALTSATAQGAASGSGLAGGQGQIGSQTAENLQGINQASELGAGIFKANAQQADAQTLASFGNGLSSLGQTISGLHYGDN